MKQIDYTKIVKVEIHHKMYQYSDVTVCNISNYIDTLNYLAKKGVEIIGIRFYE